MCGAGVKEIKESSEDEQGSLSVLQVWDALLNTMRTRVERRLRASLFLFLF